MCPLPLLPGPVQALTCVWGTVLTSWAPLPLSPPRAATPCLGLSPGSGRPSPGGPSCQVPPGAASPGAPRAWQCPPGGPLAPHAPSSVRSVRLTSESPCPSHRGAVVRGGRARLTMTPRPSTGPTREAACQSRTQTRKRTSPHRVRFCPSRPDPGVTVALDRHAWPAAHSLPFCLLVGPRPPYSTSAPLSLVHSRRCYSPSSPRRVRFQLVLAGGAREPRGRRPRSGRGAPLIRAWWGGRPAVCACARLPVPRTASSRRALRPAPSPGHCQSPRPPPPGR